MEKVIDVWNITKSKRVKFFSGDRTWPETSFNTKLKRFDNKIEAFIGKKCMLYCHLANAHVDNEQY